MTRKDFELIAAAVNHAIGYANREEDTATRLDQRRGMERLAGVLASYLACDHPRFDRAKFLKACGVES